MSKFIQKIKENEILQSSRFKVATVCCTALTTFAQSAHAAETIDIVGPMTTSFQTVTANCLAAIGALAPIGLTIFGAMFAWKKGTQFFKHLTQG